jgi:putative transposase
MPRKARIDAPGGLQHIIVRGIERRNIFFDDVDRNNFLTRLSAILSDTRTQCFAWALIPNHVHLLLRTGAEPISTVMRRLLTGYAVSINRRYQRHGHLFQNRYKSILCEEDPYLLELVRYIHLNPLRAQLLEDLNQLDNYPYSGHSALMGKSDRPWQNVDCVIRLFGETRSTAIRGYREFVAKGVATGSRPYLVGGGLVRSAGGWSAVKMLRKEETRMKADERILGNGNFVETVLKNADENLERKYALQSNNYDFNWLIEQVASSLNMRPNDVIAPGRYKNVVKARSVLCYWGIRELGMSAVELAKRLRLSQATISQSAMRGRQIAMAKGLQLDICQRCGDHPQQDCQILLRAPMPRR